MLLGVTVGDIIAFLGNDRETTLKEMKRTLDYYGVKYSDERKQAYTKAELSEVCILSLETPRCWHWSLYSNGVFYDPEHGVSDDFPDCERKYYWEIKIC